MSAGVVAAVAALGADLGVVIELEAVDGVGRDAERAAARRAMTAALARACAPAPIDGHETDGRPRWPPGWTGSVAHGAGWAVVAVTTADRMVGVDVERTAALSPDDAALVLDERERASAASAAMATTIWSAKEAAFKAWSTAAGGLADVDPVDIHIAVDGGRIRATASGALAGLPPLDGTAIETDRVVLTVLLGA